MSLEEFENTILNELKKLMRLEYLCVGDNPIATQFPELKYRIIYELLQLRYYDYLIITQQMRSTASLVKNNGIEALKQSSRANKEEIRLKAEQRDSLFVTEKFNLGDESERSTVKIEADYTLRLPESILIHIFSFLPTNSLKSCCQVRKKWKFLASNLYIQRCCSVLKNYNVVIASDYYQKLYQPFMDLLHKNLFLSSVEHRITPISYFDEVCTFFFLQFV